MNQLIDVGVEHCLELCQSMARCGAVEYQRRERSCYMNRVIGVK